MNPNHSLLTKHLARIISETNGITLADTLELAVKGEPSPITQSINEFRDQLALFNQDRIQIESLLGHPVCLALFDIFSQFPLKYREEHIHLTGSLTSDFVFPRLQKALEGPYAQDVKQEIFQTFGETAKFESLEQVTDLMTLKSDEYFDRYLQILLLPKMILKTRQDHRDAAYHMAQDLYCNYNVGLIRLKFTLSRVAQAGGERVPGIEQLTEEDVVLGLYEGFISFKAEHPDFNFILSPSFRKEADYYDAKNFPNKADHFMAQIDTIIELLEKYPELRPHLCEVDTVGNERSLYRKSHFNDMKLGFRKLQYMGFAVKSHHGETWNTLRQGVQAVDNAMNIWHIDTLEHGLSLGINPNFYFHSLYQRAIEINSKGQAINKESSIGREIMDMDWSRSSDILDKLLQGKQLNLSEETSFVKLKFHTAREVEHYQHDVLNRMIHKNVHLVSLPSSNNKLTGHIPDFKDHPFSWWEKKGVNLGVGTDNYVTLNTNYIQEMLILLLTDSENLKLTKLLMVATGENRRPLMSQKLWRTRESVLSRPDGI